MRDLREVLNRIIKSVGHLYGNNKNINQLLIDLNQIKYNLMYNAPECSINFWYEVGYIIKDFFLDDKVRVRKDYLYNLGIEVFSIFSGVSEEEIRKYNE